MNTNFETISRSLRADRRVTEAKMFDARTLRLSGKIFAMLVKGALVVKLPRKRAEAFVAARKGDLFDPGHGRLMRQWLAITPRPGSDWLRLAKEAKTFAAGAAGH